MKKQLLLFLITIFISFQLLAQTNSETRSVEHFDKIKIESIVQVEIYKGKQGNIEIETENVAVDKVKSKVSNGVLILDLQKNRKKGYQNITVLVKVYTEDLDAIQGHTASSFKTMDHFSFDEISINLNSASSGYMDIDAEKINVNLNSASSLELSGSAEYMKADINSASRLNAYDLVADKVKANVSSVAVAKINAEKELDVCASSLSKVNYIGDPQIYSENKSSMANITKRSGQLKRIE